MLTLIPALDHFLCSDLSGKRLASARVRQKYNGGRPHRERSPIAARVELFPIGKRADVVDCDLICAEQGGDHEGPDKSRESRTHRL